MRWKIYKRLQRILLAWGLSHGYIAPYSEGLIEKLRNVYYGGVPASILLLCDGMTNGYCYDRATLMARVFLDEGNDLRLICASIASLRLNPRYAGNPDPLTTDHCFVEVTNADGRRVIIDTSSWFVWDKRLYWLLERPQVRMTHDKEELRKFVEVDEAYESEEFDTSKYWAPLLLPLIELTYGRKTELYSQPEIGLLQREVEHYKKLIDYDAVWREVDEDMQAHGFSGLKPPA